MHLSSLQREQETRFRSNMRNTSKADFAPMQRDGFQNSKWAGFIKPTGYKPMCVLFWLFLIQQFSGIYITLFFAVTFFQVRMTRVIIAAPCDPIYHVFVFAPFIGSWNQGRRILFIHFCWCHTFCDVSAKCMAVETFQTSPIGHVLVYWNGTLYVHFRHIYQMDQRRYNEII